MNGEDGDDLVVREERVTISRAALRLELLEMEVRLKEFFASRLSTVEGDVRALQALNERREAAEIALAVETERRRKELASGQTSRGFWAAGITAAATVASAGWWVPSLFHH